MIHYTYMGIPFSTNTKMLDAVVTTTTSEAFDVSKRQQITIEFSSPDVSSGNAVFTIDATNDDVAAGNWITGIAFQDALATASTTWVTSKTINSGTKIGGCYVKAGWRFIRVVCTRTTDGTYTATLQNGG